MEIQVTKKMMSHPLAKIPKDSEALCLEFTFEEGEFYYIKKLSYSQWRAVYYEMDETGKSSLLELFDEVISLFKCDNRAKLLLMKRDLSKNSATRDKFRNLTVRNMFCETYMETSDLSNDAAMTIYYTTNTNIYELLSHHIEKQFNHMINE